MALNARRVLRARFGAHAVPIDVGAGILPELGARMRAEGLAPGRALVVTTPPVAQHHGNNVLRALRRGGFRPVMLSVPDGESSKSIEILKSLHEDLLDAGADRDTIVVALGGGVVGDLAGFAAATLLRGLPLVHVPTTLLAMVDSSIGGKTGINLPRGKNLVGAFHQPRLVFSDTAVLKTLPPSELRAGLAEVVKHAAIRDARLFAKLEKQSEHLAAGEIGLLTPIIARNCRIKADIVARDEKESGLRMLLNFGHTLGHAVEALTGYHHVLHGEAVAMGMVFAARRSEALGLCAAGAADRLEALLQRIGLPTELPGFARADYLRALLSDKKRRGARIHFVALREIGLAETRLLTPAQLLPAALFRGTKAQNRLRARTSTAHSTGKRSTGKRSTGKRSAAKRTTRR